MGSHQPIRKIVTPTPPEIPDKLYFRIGDVAKLCALPAYVLRFWETEFPQLKPHKGGTGQRLYRKRDVEMALRIKSLLYDQGYTIPGARQVFKSEAATGRSEIPATASIEAIAEIPHTEPLHASHREAQLEARLKALRAELAGIHTLLAAGPSTTSAEPTSNVKTMRPRLQLEPIKHRLAPIAVVSDVDRPRLQLQQRDLFGSGEPEPDIPA